MNNNFDKLAEQFISDNLHEADEDEWSEDELEDEIRLFISSKGIDEAWEDEALEVIKDAFTAARD